MIPKTKSFILLLALANTINATTFQKVLGGTSIDTRLSQFDRLPLDNLTFRDSDVRVDFSGKVVDDDDWDSDELGQATVYKHAHEIEEALRSVPRDQGSVSTVSSVANRSTADSAATSGNKSTVSAHPSKFTDFIPIQVTLNEKPQQRPLSTTFRSFSPFQRKPTPKPQKVIPTASREESDLYWSQYLTESLTSEYHLKRHQITQILAAYARIFPQPQVDPERCTQTLPLVALLAKEIDDAVAAHSYELTMNNMELWELLAGFVYTTGSSSSNFSTGSSSNSSISPDTRPEPILQVINRQAATVPIEAIALMRDQSSQLYRLLLALCGVSDKERFIDMQERTRRQVVRTIGAASTLPLQAAEEVGGGDHLRVLGTQNEVFYRPELLLVSAVFANTFDSTQAPELFNFLVRQRCAGVWGPRREELNGILKGRSYRLDNREFSPAQEQLVLAKDFMEASIEKARKLMRLAADRDARLFSSNISVLDAPLSEELVQESLLKGTLTGIINACSTEELKELEVLLSVILQKHQQAVTDYEQLKERILRQSSSKDLRSLMRRTNATGEPILKSPRQASPRRMTTVEPVPRRMETAQASPRRMTSTEPATTQSRPLSARILGTLARLSPIQHESAPVMPAPAPVQMQTKTLEDVVDGALKIIAAINKAPISEELRSAAFAESNLVALRSFFLNTCSHQNVKSLIMAVLDIGRKYPVFKDRGGEFLYAAYLLTLSAKKRLRLRLDDELFRPMMDEMRDLLATLARKSNLFTASGSFNSSSDEGLPETFSDSDSDGLSVEDEDELER